MGAVEHLKTLCCLGLPPESAMIAVVPLLHEIIPHGWLRLGLVAPDATIGNGFVENPAADALYRERLWTLMDNPSALVSLWVPLFRAVGIGWTLHRQGGAYLESAYYREIEAPLDSCWVLDAMIGDMAGLLDLFTSCVRVARTPLRRTTFSVLTGSGLGSHTHSGGPHPMLRATGIGLQ
jgi:hypothetical protein